MIPRPCCSCRRELDAIHAKLNGFGIPSILRAGDPEMTTEERVAYVCGSRVRLQAEMLDAWRVLQPHGYTDYDPHLPKDRNAVTLASRVAQILDRMQRAETQVAALKQLLNDAECAQSVAEDRLADLTAGRAA